jgi:hypothetical protein
LKSKTQNWSHRVRTLENRLNKLEIVLEKLKNKVEYERLSEDKNLQNIEWQEQSIAIIENKKRR